MTQSTRCGGGGTARWMIASTAYVAVTVANMHPPARKFAASSLVGRTVLSATSPARSRAALSRT